MQKVLFAFLVSTMSFGVFAQANVLATQVGTSTVNWSGTSYLSYESNLYKKSSINSKSATSVGLTLNYHVKDAHIIRGSFSAEQEHTQQERSRLNDGFLAWVNNSFWRRGKLLTIGQQVRTNVSLSEESRVRDQKNIGVALIPSFVFNLTPVGLTGVTFIYQPQAVRNFHQYKQNREYKNNVAYGVSHSMILSWSMTDKLYLQPAFIYGSSWSYGNTKKDDNYSFITELGYSIKNNITLAAGLSSDGAIRNFQNGNDQTVQLYNKNTASVYSALYYVF